MQPVRKRGMIFLSETNTMVKILNIGVILQKVSIFTSQPGLTENWLNIK